MKKTFFAATAAAIAIGLGGGALADGLEPASGAATKIVRFGSAVDSGVSVKTEEGVKVYRGAPTKREKLAGAPAPLARIVVARKEMIIEHHYHSRIRRLRTQGFYSGHPGKSRRFTQGFYSGPASMGRR